MGKKVIQMVDDKLKTWVKCKTNYEVCKETSEIKSCARVIRNTFSNNRRITEKILKPQNGFVTINGQHRKVLKIYKEVYGVEYVPRETCKKGLNCGQCNQFKGQCIYE